MPREKSWSQTPPTPPRRDSLRIPPQNLDAEKAVLGSIMLKPGSLIELADRLSPDAFYSDKHKKIYEIMFELSQKNEPIDSLSIAHLLKEKKMLEAVGGARYLTELTNAVPSSTNVGYYADIVEQKYILRRLIESADMLAEMGYESGTNSIEDILDTAEKQIFALADGPKRTKYLSLKDTLDEAFKRFEKLHEQKDGLRGVSTGYQALDDMLSGFQKSDLIILAARPSMGKTTLALDMARMTSVKHGTGVGIFSLEMSSQQLVDRMLAAESRVNAWQLRTGKLSPGGREFQHLATALDTLSKAPIFIDDQPSSSIVHIRSVARRLKAEHNIGLIIVDYLQLMTTTKNYDSMVNQVTEISRSLKALAREIDVPVIALSQLSRAVEARGGEPRLSDLRDSGSIEQDADVVMFIHREDKYNKDSERTNIAKIMIEKHRNGPTGHVELYFDDKTTSFMPLDKGNMDAFTASSSLGATDVEF